ncbi:MFS-type transporter clz9-like [Vanessa cardui]|uniref:MFS-type transporter clz9-like n=1 Tax=Vanessa cardui TaxID=171605 RepID=UPI001F146D80|nr:MFS-type transporter clz9-like [Vanessa cardui]
MGPSTILSKEEENILEIWIKEMLDKHIPVTKDQLLDSVQRIIIDKNQETLFSDNRPGNKWYTSFLKRHPTITKRVAQNLCTTRDNVTQEDIEKWFSEVESDLKDRGLIEIVKHPERVFNTDESAFFLNPKPEHVLARKGDKNSSSGDDKENLTVLITGNAAGELAPILVVFNYARIPSLISENFPDDWAIGRSESGRMCSGTFYEYMTNVFNPWLIKKNIEKPITFFLDGHKSHLTLHLSNFCSDNGIEVIALNLNSTHILQPMDLAVFRPLKSFWRESVKNWKTQHLGQVLKKQHFNNSCRENFC